MGLNYNTLEKLLNHPQVKTYIDWRKKRVSLRYIRKFKYLL